MKNFKVKLVFFFLVLFSLAIITRLFYLQIQKGSNYQAWALGQQTSFEEIQGERGGIFFNDGVNRAAQSTKDIFLYVFPKQVPAEEKEKTIGVLADSLGESQASLAVLFAKGETIKREVSREILNKISGQELSGVQFDESWGRNYPQGDLASHIIGFANEENNGQYGIEGFYNNLLKGNETLKTKGKSPFGYLIFSGADFEETELAPKGSDIVLTIDYNIQYFAEKALINAKETMNIESGQIIVEDPATGKILAMADFPEFNPNEYKKEKKMGVFINSCSQKLFEPGSVFKPITFAGAIEENLIKPDETYIDAGSVSVGGPAIYNFHKRIWGEQTMIDVLRNSINTGAVYVQQKLGRGPFLDFLDKFGFFEPTGIDLQSETFSKNETLRNGYPRDIASASFGQGVEVTPIQVVRAFGAIANKGEMMKPYLAEKIIDGTGQETIINPEKQRNVISQSAAETISEMMVEVVETGSGKRAKIDGYQIAGKTGTAQVPLSNGGYSETATIQSFIGFFPAYNPQILIFVKLDNPESATAEYSASPVFREIAKYIIDYMQIPPSENY